MQPTDAAPWPVLGEDGPVVIVHGRVAYRIARLLGTELRRARDNGEVLDADLIATIRAIEACGAAYAHRIMAAATEVPPEAAADTGLLTTAEVARRLGCTDRNVRALATRGALPAIRSGRTWLFDPVEVEEHRTA